MFLGTYAPKLDEKGRIIMPARFAEELADGVVLTRGQERCVYAFPQAEFERMHESLRQAPLTSAQARGFLRVFLSGAHAEVPDKQRRVTIPAALRQYAGLEKDLTVLGVGTRLEIWDAAAWETYLGDQEDAFASTAEEVIPGLF